MKTSFVTAVCSLICLAACEASPSPVAPSPAPVVTSAATVKGQPAVKLDPLADGRVCTQALYGHGDLWARLGPPARELVGNDPKGLAAFQAKVGELGA